MNLCFKCAKLQKTCCQNTDIILTDKDIARIDSRGHNDFNEFRHPMSLNYNQFEDPNWDIYTMRSDKKMQLVKRRENGSCYFLEENGCILDIGSRPLICRLYPYHYNEESLFKIDAYRCPADWIKGDDFNLIHSEFDLNSENSIKWHHDFYNELKEGRIHYENRHNL